MEPSTLYPAKLLQLWGEILVSNDSTAFQATAMLMTLGIAPTVRQRPLKEALTLSIQLQLHSVQIGIPPLCIITTLVDINSSRAPVGCMKVVSPKRPPPQMPRPQIC